MEITGTADTLLDTIDPSQFGDDVGAFHDCVRELIISEKRRMLAD